MNFEEKKPSQKELDALMNFYKIRNFKEAEKLASSMSVVYPYHVSSYKVLAEIYRIQKRHEELLKVSRKILQLSPQDHEMYNIIGVALSDLGKFKESISAFRKLIEFKPDNYVAYCNLGVSLTKTKDLEEAIKCLDKSIELKSDFSVAYNNLGDAYIRLGQLKNAEFNFKKATELDNTLHPAFFNLGSAQFKLGKIIEAEISFKKSLELKKNYHVAHCQLAHVQTELGKNREAELSYLNALNLKKDNGSANYGLGLLYYQQKKFKEASKYFLLAENYNDCQNYILRCFYLEDEKDNFYDQLDKMIAKDIKNCVMGSLIMRSENRYGIKKNNFFCNEPMKYISKIDLTKEIDFENIFVNTLKNILDKHNFKNQPLLTNGQQSSGNLFLLEDESIKKIKNVLLSEIEKYRNYFKDSNEGLIKNWPVKFELYGWLVKMNNGGSLKSHMHDNGWLSGSVYINIPKKNKPDSGNLVLSSDYDETHPNYTPPKKKLFSFFRKNKRQIRNIDLITGNLCLFPSSLLHHTIPFESKEDRIVLAFDVVSKS